MSRQFHGKVFCIGANKSGTTSIGAAVESLGYRLGIQTAAEPLFYQWAAGRFDGIIDYCRDADAFQDIPFSLEGTYRALDAAFPGSKFILTVRDSPEQWHRSLVRFHTQILGRDREPTAADLREFVYCGPGWLWDVMRLAFGSEADAVYDRDRLVSRYVAHNRAVLDYFCDRPDDLLVLNLSRPDSMELLCGFLGVEWTEEMRMPHLNRSRPMPQPVDLVDRAVTSA